MPNCWRRIGWRKNQQSKTPRVRFPVKPVGWKPVGKEIDDYLGHKFNVKEKYRTVCLLICILGGESIFTSVPIKIWRDTRTNTGET